MLVLDEPANGLTAGSAGRAVCSGLRGRAAPCAAEFAPAARSWSRSRMTS
ncbi:hypothetical protein QJS66_16090 [Kocuria rhizophila]|nr:hypothetical protein QJS66_16090 [Kocuria rhizophila]